MLSLAALSKYDAWFIFIEKEERRNFKV